MSLVVVVVKSRGGERSMTFLCSLLATHTYQNVFFLSFNKQQRNIELGRVALVNLKADKLYGKLVVVVDLARRMSA